MNDQIKRNDQIRQLHGGEAFPLYTLPDNMNVFLDLVESTKSARQKSIIPPEKVVIMRDYARNLRRRYPRKNMDWITQQTAKHFKIKLI